MSSRQEIVESCQNLDGVCGVWQFIRQIYFLQRHVLKPQAGLKYPITKCFVVKAGLVEVWPSTQLNRSILVLGLLALAGGYKFIEKEGRRKVP